MSLFGKIKDLFADEEMIEEPIKKEVMKVEITSPIKEEKIDVSDSEIIKNEEVKAPIFFNDKDFEDITVQREIPKTVKNSSYLKPVKKEEEKKVFRPSPIISPVYGVLDKNYRKDDITSKVKSDSPKETSKQVTIDDIRKKAFGTLEDDLQENLFATNSVLFNDVASEEETPEIDIFAEMEEENLTREKINEDIYEEENDFSDSEESNDDYEEETYEEVRSIKINDGSTLEDDLKNIFEESNERIEEDLFNLIDSMYESEDEN